MTFGHIEQLSAANNELQKLAGPSPSLLHPDPGLNLIPADLLISPGLNNTNDGSSGITDDSVMVDSAQPSPVFPHQHNRRGPMVMNVVICQQDSAWHLVNEVCASIPLIVFRNLIKIFKIMRLGAR